MMFDFKGGWHETCGIEDVENVWHRMRWRCGCFRTVREKDGIVVGRGFCRAHYAELVSGPEYILPSPWVSG